MVVVLAQLITTLLFLFPGLSSAELSDDITYAHVGKGAIINLSEPLHFEPGTSWARFTTSDMDHCTGINEQERSCSIVVSFFVLDSDEQSYRTLSGPLMVKEFDSYATGEKYLIVQSKNQNLIRVSCRKKNGSSLNYVDCNLGEFRAALATKGATVTLPIAEELSF